MRGNVSAVRRHDDRNALCQRGMRLRVVVCQRLRDRDQPTAFVKLKQPRHDPALEARGRHMVHFQHKGNAAQPQQNQHRKRIAHVAQVRARPAQVAPNDIRKSEDRPHDGNVRRPRKDRLENWRHAVDRKGVATITRIAPCEQADVRTLPPIAELPCERLAHLHDVHTVRFTRRKQRCGEVVQTHEVGQSVRLMSACRHLALDTSHGVSQSGAKRSSQISTRPLQPAGGAARLAGFPSNRHAKRHAFGPCVQACDTLQNT